MYGTGSRIIHSPPTKMAELNLGPAERGPQPAPPGNRRVEICHIRSTGWIVQSPHSPVADLTGIRGIQPAVPMAESTCDGEAPSSIACSSLSWDRPPKPTATPGSQTTRVDRDRYRALYANDSHYCFDWRSHVSSLPGPGHAPRLRKLGVPLPAPHPSPLGAQPPDHALLGALPGPPGEAAAHPQGDEDHRLPRDRRRDHRDARPRREDLTGRPSSLAPDHTAVQPSRPLRGTPTHRTTWPGPLDPLRGTPTRRTILFRAT